MLVLIFAALAGLQPGSTVRLPAGRQGPIVIKGQSFDPPVTIDATGAVVAGLEITESSGIIWRGGTIEAPNGSGDGDITGPGRGHGPLYNAATIGKSRNITFDNVTFTNAKNGIAAGRTNGLTVRNSRFDGMRSDGIDSVTNSHVLIENNHFFGSQPIRATGSKTDGTFIDGDHPDAVQFWMRKDSSTATDVIVRKNLIEGRTQGINTFGFSADGYQRFVVEDNTLVISYPAAISLMNCADCRIVNNSVKSTPDARFRANVRTDKSTGKFCGNRIESIPNHAANARCSKP